MIQDFYPKTSRWITLRDGHRIAGSLLTRRDHPSGSCITFIQRDSGFRLLGKGNPQVDRGESWTGSLLGSGELRAQSRKATRSPRELLEPRSGALCYTAPGSVNEVARPDNCQRSRRRGDRLRLTTKFRPFPLCLLWSVRVFRVKLCSQLVLDKVRQTS